MYAFMQPGAPQGWFASKVYNIDGAYSGLRSMIAGGVIEPLNDLAAAQTRATAAGQKYIFNTDSTGAVTSTSAVP